MKTPQYKKWQCGYCEHSATIRDGDLFEKEEMMPLYDNVDLSYTVTAIACLNPNCGKLNLQFKINEHACSPDIMKIVHSSQSLAMDSVQGRNRFKYSWCLLPDSKAKIFPNFVPQTIRDDYEEACKIVNLSPKASATLSRRCLQTIIRDFWGVKNKGNLKEEIDALLEKTDLNPDLINAFHELRKIGNIGAHMEKDVNLIIDVDPEEAEHLIKVIEYIIQMTYVEKQKHKELFEKLTEISNDKASKKHKK